MRRSVNRRPNPCATGIPASSVPPPKPSDNRRIPSTSRRCWTRLVDIPPDDVALRHTLRIALRNQLRDERLLADVAARAWPSAELRELADVALALRSAESASLVLDYVAAHQLPASDLERFLPYAARYVSPSRVGQLAREARRQAGEALALQATLFRSIQQSLPTQRWAAEPELVAWGQELVTGLIASVQAQELKWQIDSGASIWGLEPRTAHDGFETSFLSSLPGGEAELGRLVSKPFEIPAKLSFEVCGHRGDPTTVAVPQGNLPGQELAGDIDDNFVQLRLVETGQIVQRAFPHETIGRSGSRGTCMNGSVSLRCWRSSIECPARPTPGWPSPASNRPSSPSPHKTHARLRAGS